MIERAVFFFLMTSLAFLMTELDLSNRIVIDGFSEEFTLDEYILSDSLGSLLESPTDSYWGEYNDVKQIKVTWDTTYLYISVDACSWDNNVLLFIDTDNSYGIENMIDLNAWQRSFTFYNFNPNYFIGTWDTNNLPQFWEVQYQSSMHINHIQSIETVATFDTGNLNGSMEAKIPWDYLNSHTGQVHSIRLLSLITSGEDYTGSPDCAPDNLGGMENDSGQMVVLDNFAQIIIDGNQDGEPDIGVKPQARTTFYKKPPFEPISLQIEDVVFEDKNTFVPLDNERLYFELITNRGTDFIVKIFDLNGKFIDFSEKESSSLSWSWDGRDKNGIVVPFGIYILHFVSESGEAAHKEPVVVIK